MRNRNGYGHTRGMLLGLVLSVPLLFACQGPQGPTGPVGPKGAKGDTGSTGSAGSSCTVADNGDGTKTITCGDGTTVTISNGQPGVSTGTVTGTVTSSLGGGAAGVDVTETPDVGVTTQTDSTGAFSMDLPVGVYTITFGSADYASKDVPAVSLVAGATATVSVTLDRNNPLTVTAPPIYLAGFGQNVDLGVTVAGDTGTLTYAWTQTGGPTTVTLTGADTATPSFTTASFDAIVTAGTVPNLYRDERTQVQPITHNQLAKMSYTFEVTVSDGTFTTKATQTVQPASKVASWNQSFPVGLMLITNDLTAASYNWAITSAPAGSTATLNDATTRNAWFIPDVEGVYTLTDNGNTLRIVAATWKGAETTCKLCHANQSNPDMDQYDEWKASGHAHHMENGVNGVLGSHYSMSCVPCHSVGYDPAANNGGFDDVMASDGWQFPKVLQPGNYAAMPAELKNLANIQCENCHGPGSQHNGDTTKISKNFDARTCAFCHDAPPHHDRFPLWSMSGHSNRALALEEATTEGRGTTAAHCGRCHSAQGFAYWSEQILTTGNTGRIAKPDGSAADLAFLNSLGLNDANVQPQTCAACHDPHSLELRVDGTQASMPLPAGFNVSGLGKGTLCITCHNSRNGEHDDMNPPTSYSGPHVAAQGDVFMGKNAYWVDGYNVSRHSAITDTCVTCHVKLIPASVSTSGSNHTFMPDKSICANCHSPDVTGVGLQAQVQQGLDDLGSLIATGVGARLSYIVNAPTANTYAVRAYDPATGLYSSSSSSSSNVTLTQAPTVVAVTEVHGQEALDLTFANPVSITWSDGSSTSVTDVQFQLGSLVDSTGTAIFPVDGVLVKALWNRGLIENDKTLGIHNPSFTLKVLSATYTQLQPWSVYP